jgi:hypothetical protein
MNSLRNLQKFVAFSYKSRGRQDVPKTVISNLVKGGKIEVAKFLINQIVDPDLKN